MRRQNVLVILLSERLLRSSSPPVMLQTLQQSATMQSAAILVLITSVNVDTLIVRTRSRVHCSLQWRSFVFSSFVSPSPFRSHFRMPRPAFVKLLGILEPYITKQDTAFGKTIPAAVRLAIFLVFCGHGCSLRLLSVLFGIGRSTGSAIVCEVSCDIVKHMGSYVEFSSTREQMLKYCMEFEEGYGIPGCMGALDGCHVPIVQPSIPNSKKYFNRKSFYSFNVSAIVDRGRRFLDVDVKWPGSVGNSRVFHNSAIGRVHGELFARLGGTEGAGQLLTGLNEHYKIPFYLLADSAYANSTHVVTTFEISEAESDVAVGRLNKALAGMRYPIECAFGILKARWRLVGKPIEIARTNIEEVPAIISSVCILHNFVIDEGDGVWDEHAEARQRAFYFANFVKQPNDSSDHNTICAENKTRDALLKLMQFRESVRAG